MLHGVRVRVSPSAPNLKKADFMSAFFCLFFLSILKWAASHFFVIKSIQRTFITLKRIFLFLLSPKFVNLVRMIFSMMFNRVR